MISPYSKPGVDDQYYTQLNMVKTIEQILGIHAMNQEDYAAEPMYGAFTDTGNFAPYDVAKNIIPLNLGAPGGPDDVHAVDHAGSRDQDGRIPRRRSVRRVSSRRNVKRHLRPRGSRWIGQQDAKGHFNGPDRVNSEQLNRYDWYSAHDWKVAYPGDPKIYRPNQVPGRKLPASFIGGD